MKKRKLIATSAVMLLTFLAVPGFAAHQLPKSLTASAQGKGTIKVGREQFKLNAVTVKLLEGGEAEIILVSDITLFFGGTWSAGTAPGEIDLKITGAASKSAVQGSGQLFLRDDGKSIARLTLQGSSKIQKRNVVVSFVAQ